MARWGLVEGRKGIGLPFLYWVVVVAVEVATAFVSGLLARGRTAWINYQRRYNQTARPAIPTTTITTKSHSPRWWSRF
jgi:hypothetical protein